MSATKKLNNITAKQIADKGVQALATRPNTTAQYGVGGFSPTQLKLWFDKLATFISDKINEIQNTLVADDAASYVRILLDDYNVENLNDLVSALIDGAFAEKILKLYPSASANELSTLQSVINDISQKLSNDTEELRQIWATCGTDIVVSLDSSSHDFTITLLNKSNTVLKTYTINTKVTTNKLIDACVTTEKLAAASVTKDKISDKSVTTEKLADASVTKDKIANGAVTGDKISYSAIDGSKIKYSAIDNAHLKSGCVNGSKIASTAITADKIAAGSVGMDKLSSNLSNRIISLENDAFCEIVYDKDTGTLTFKTTGGAKKSITLPLTLIVSGGYYDSAVGDEAVVLVLANGDEIRIPVNSMLSELTNYMDGIRKKIYDLQEAPPISAMSDSLLLCTPTLAQLAALE